MIKFLPRLPLPSSSTTSNRVANESCVRTELPQFQGASSASKEPVFEGRFTAYRGYCEHFMGLAWTLHLAEVTTPEFLEHRSKTCGASWAVGDGAGRWLFLVPDLKVECFAPRVARQYVRRKKLEKTHLPLAI